MAISYTDDQFDEALVLAYKEQKRLLTKSKQLVKGADEV